MGERSWNTNFCEYSVPNNGNAQTNRIIEEFLSCKWTHYELLKSLGHTFEDILDNPSHREDLDMPAHPGEDRNIDIVTCI